MRHSAFSSVVLPEPVPPEIRMLSRHRAGDLQHPRHRPRTMLPFADHAAKSSFFLANLRIEMHGPSSASGGKTMLTRLPSASRASTIGLDSSMRRPTAATICCATIGDMLRVAEPHGRALAACRARST